MIDTATTAPLGALVREKREGLQLSMDELATRARVSRSTLHRIEHGHAVRSEPAKLARVLAVIGVTGDELRAVIDDEEYLGHVLIWMERGAGLAAAQQALAPAPHMRPLTDKPDLVVIDQESGEVARVYAASALADKIAALLERAGMLVTQPREA